MASTSSQNISLQPVNDLHDSDYRWFAIYTKYKAEKHVIKNLSRKGITAYTPLLNKTKRYSRKVKTFAVPLLNCYVFVHISKREYVNVLETEHVVNYVKIRKNLVAIPQREIDLLKRIVGEFEDISIAREEYKIGDLVEVVGGKLTGLKGNLVNVNGKKDVLICLDSTGFQLLINIDPKLLRTVTVSLV